MSLMSPASGPGRGLFITLEGIDGSGKSVQSVRLARWLEERTGRGTLRTFEPGGWEGGQALRSLILNEALDPQTELLLFLADRSGHVDSVIRPALDAGQNVLCERYTDSTWAYQAAGRGLAPEKVRDLMDRCDFLKPDLTVFLKIEPERAAARLLERGRADRIESGGPDFMARVAMAYEELARREPGRIMTVQAGGTEEETASEIKAGLERRLNKRRLEALPS